METIEIKNKQTELASVSLKLPYYSKDGCHAHYISPTGKAVSVCHSSRVGLDIKECSPESAYFPGDETPCTKEEFDAIYQQVAMKLALIII